MNFRISFESRRKMKMKKMLLINRAPLPWHCIDKNHRIFQLYLEKSLKDIEMNKTRLVLSDGYIDKAKEQYNKALSNPDYVAFFTLFSINFFYATLHHQWKKKKMIISYKVYSYFRFLLYSHSLVHCRFLFGLFLSP
jgi:hypothetical protein